MITSDSTPSLVLESLSFSSHSSRTSMRTRLWKCVCADDGGQGIWGPQFVWTNPSVHHVPQAETEVEATKGTDVVYSNAGSTGVMVSGIGSNSSATLCLHPAMPPRVSLKLLVSMSPSWIQSKTHDGGYSACDVGKSSGNTMSVGLCSISLGIPIVPTSENVSSWVT